MGSLLRGDRLTTGARHLRIKVAFTPLGVIVASVFIGLPFVVRTVQPVLHNLDSELEEAAASHAVKGDRRYRYYVSRSLMKGSAAQVEGGWRLPAAEIERSVAAAAKSILDDPQAVVSTTEGAALDSSRIAPILKSAAA
jgi:hypothetical protein